MPGCGGADGSARPPCSSCTGGCGGCGLTLLSWDGREAGASGRRDGPRRWVQDVGLREAGRDLAAPCAREEMAWEAAAGKTEEGEDAPGDCVVCLDQWPVFALTECGHFGMCAACCERVLAGQRRCPVCNVAIVYPPLRIFRS